MCQSNGYVKGINERHDGHELHNLSGQKYVASQPSLASEVRYIVFTRIDDMFSEPKDIEPLLQKVQLRRSIADLLLTLLFSSLFRHSKRVKWIRALTHWFHQQIAISLHIHACQSFPRWVSEKISGIFSRNSFQFHVLLDNFTEMEVLCMFWYFLFQKSLVCSTIAMPFFLIETMVFQCMTSIEHFPLICKSSIQDWMYWCLRRCNLLTDRHVASLIQSLHSFRRVLFSFVGIETLRRNWCVNSLFQLNI